MVIWTIVRNKPFVSLLVIVAASLVVWLVSEIGGPMIASALVAVTCAAIYVQYRRGQRSDARAALNTFTFAEVVSRMRTRDDAHALTKERTPVGAAP